MIEQVIDERSTTAKVTTVDRRVENRSRIGLCERGKQPSKCEAEGRDANELGESLGSAMQLIENQLASAISHRLVS